MVDSVIHSFTNIPSLYFESGCICKPQLNIQHLRLLMESSGLQECWAALQTDTQGLQTTPSGLSQQQAAHGTDLLHWFLFHCCDKATSEREGLHIHVLTRTAITSYRKSR